MQIPHGGELGTKAGAGVVHRLVQGPAVGGDPLREDVYGHAVDEQGDGDPALMRGQHSVHGDGNRASHVGPLGLLFGIEVLGGGQVSEVQVAQLDGYKYAITQEENGWAVDITDPDGGFDSTVCATIEEAKQYCENIAAEVQAEEE